MYNIIVGTTPTITYNYKTVSPSDFRTAILTIKSAGAIIIEKTLSDAVVWESSLSWTLSQEETLLLGTNTAKMMCNFVTFSGKRGASEETTITGVTNHVREVI